MKFLIIILSLLMGLSFIIGAILSTKLKSKKMNYFSISLAFVIFMAVIFTDIAPEICELTKNYTDLVISLCGIVAGISVLKLFDLVIPHHSHDHEHNDDNKADHKKHLYHIGILTFISVSIHNVFEGIIFYEIALSSLKSGLFMACAIALHNIPLGIEMASFLRSNKKKYLKRNIALILTGTVGTIIGLAVGELSATSELIILSITFGMMLYTGIIELGVETFKDRKEKGIVEGILVGAIIFALMLI